MRRLSPLCLMTSHTHLYSKLDEFGKDFDLSIRKRVANECLYLDLHKPTTCTSSDQESHNASATVEEQCALNDMVPSRSSAHGDQCSHMQSQHTNQVALQPDKGRKITFDNFDIYQVVHHMTEQNQNKDKHYVTAMSTENRISGTHLSRTAPVGDIVTMENGKCVPNHAEHQKQKENYVVLVSRIITAHIQCLKPLEGVVVKHIPHQNKKETAQPTETVSPILVLHIVGTDLYVFICQLQANVIKRIKLFSHQ